MWQHVQLSEQIRPRQTLTRCWDVKRSVNNHLQKSRCSCLEMTLPVGPALNNNYLINKRLSLRATGWADKSGYVRPCGLSTAVLITYSAGGNRHSLLRRYLRIVLTISIKIPACLIVNYYGADAEVTSGTDRKIKKIDPEIVAAVVCWLLNVPATCECISGTDLLRQLHVSPH